MFENLQLFNELSGKEVESFLKAVLMKKKTLILMLPHRSNLRLVPFEPETRWENRMTDDLEPLKVSVEGCRGFGDKEPWPLTKWLYESKGLEELLRPYQYNPGLFWVFNESEVAVHAISIISQKMMREKEFDIGEISVNVKYLIDECGTKLETLDTVNYYKFTGTIYATEWPETIFATELRECWVPIRDMGVVDPTPNLTTLATNNEVRKEINVKQVRRDEISSNIHKYLDSCMRSNSNANIDDCWRFLEKELELHADGYLISYTQKGVAKHTTKKQVSGRFNTALKDYITK